MTINFPSHPHWLTFERVILYGGIIVIIILWQRSCNRGSTWQQKLADTEDARIKSIDSAAKVSQRIQQQGESRISSLNDKLDSVVGENEVLKYERNEAWKGISFNKSKADEAIKKLREVGGNDSTACLELADKVEKAGEQLAYYEGLNTSLIENFETIGKGKDSIISEERRLKKNALELGKQTADAYSALHSSFKRLSPHNSVWLGADVTVVPNMLLAGPQAAFQTKKGTQYQLGVGLDSRDMQYYIRAGILWKISFRK